MMDCSGCILITGGAGFIGSNLIRHLLAHEPRARVVNLDLLTYAGSMSNLSDLAEPDRHIFVKGDIGDATLVRRIIDEHEIRAVINLAAESHVDRSITGPATFIQTNIVGSFTMLEATREAWRGAYDECRFIHVSTDEVYGTLRPDDPPFSETTPYAPNSPYAASKASSDHLVRAYYETYGLPAVTTNCSNNYGPYQYPEKLVPLMIGNALAGKLLPVYGDGTQVRDWIYVEDHCAAIRSAFVRGRIGQTYNIGGSCEKKNIEVIHAICDALDSICPRADRRSYRTQITHVADRPGHDRRYAMDSAKIQSELGWAPCESFESGIDKTIRWYLDNQGWVNGVMTENYAKWITLNYDDRKEQ